MRSITDREIVALDRLSYRRLRGGLAMVSLICPIAIVVFGYGIGPLRGSFSEYYYADYACRLVPQLEAGSCQVLAGLLRDLFVGGLCMIGTLLMIYRGYSRREDLTLTLAGGCVVGIALSPMQLTLEGLSVSGWPTALHGQLHLICLTCFVLLVAYTAVVCSETTLKVMINKSTQRRYRLAYRLVGAEMIAMPIIVIAMSLVGDISRLPILLALEIIYIWSLAVFWLLKSCEITAIKLQLVDRAGDANASPAPISASIERPASSGLTF